MPHSTARPEVNTFPSADEQFRAVVRTTIEQYAPVASDALAQLVRPAYPAVEVHERQPLARIDNDLTEVWYVFRDGEVVPHHE